MSILLSDALQKAASDTRGFLSVADIKQYIRRSKNYRLDDSDPGQAGALLIFSTSNQQTWLVATSTRLYCILDDTRKPKPHINWSIGKNVILDGNGNLMIQLRSRVDTDRKGLVDIGDNHKDWLFTPSLFSGASIEERIEKLIKGQMAA